MTHSVFFFFSSKAGVLVAISSLVYDFFIVLFVFFFSFWRLCETNLSPLKQGNSQDSENSVTKLEKQKMAKHCRVPPLKTEIKKQKKRFVPFWLEVVTQNSNLLAFIFGEGRCSFPLRPTKKIRKKNVLQY